MLLLPLLVGHLLVTLALGRSGLTAAQLLAQTQGSSGWLVYYGILIVLVAVHGPIGVWQVLGRFDFAPVYLKAGIALLLAALILVLGFSALAGLYF